MFSLGFWLLSFLHSSSCFLGTKLTKLKSIIYLTLSKCSTTKPISNLNPNMKKCPFPTKSCINNIKLKPKPYENLVLQQNLYQTFNPNLINLALNNNTNIKTSVGWFFYTSSIFLPFIKLGLYQYITSSSHFVEPLPRNWPSKNLKKIEKNKKLFHENWWLFEGFEISKTNGSLIMLVLKYLKWASSLILFFWNTQNQRVFILILKKKLELKVFWKIKQSQNSNQNLKLKS